MVRVDQVHYNTVEEIHRFGEAESVEAGDPSQNNPP